MIVYCMSEYQTFSEINVTCLLGRYRYLYRAIRLIRTHNKESYWKHVRLLREIKELHGHALLKFIFR